MKGIFIDPFNKTIKEVILTENYKDIQVMLDCLNFDVVGVAGLSGIKEIKESEDLFIDGKGLDKSPTRYFKWGDRVFAGKGLILAHTITGQIIDTSVKIETIEDTIEFLSEGYIKNTIYLI